MPPLEVVTDPEKFREYLNQHVGVGPYSAGVPEGLREGLIRYLVDHIPTGHFLLAVLSNDLKEACARADTENRYRLFDIVFFLHNYAPSGAWGSREKVKAWLENRPRSGPVIKHTENDCDEHCHGCAHCYRASGDTVCDKLCRHAAENYPDGWPEE